MDGTVKLNKFAYWGDDDVPFEIGLEKFGVNLSDFDYRVDHKERIKMLNQGLVIVTGEEK